MTAKKVKAPKPKVQDTIKATKLEEEKVKASASNKKRPAE